ncbi:carbon-nitrogen hydrolase family protein [Kitasatospora sp. NPDC094028]
MNQQSVLPHHAHAARTLRLAVAQSRVPEDPSDPELLRASGQEIRQLMREAADAGARLVQFPEGALVYPNPRTMPTDPASCAGHVDWSATRWDVLQEEGEAIRALAGELGLWTAFGTIRPIESARPRNSLLVVSDQGEVVACYDKRILSNTERTRLYSPGADPVVFEVDGWRFGVALCVEANFHELFVQYESMDVDCVLLSVMVDDAMRADLAKSYGTLFNFWLGYSVPAQYGATAPAGVIAPGGAVLAHCPAENRSAVTVTDLDLDTADPVIATGLNLARPWRRLARVQGIDAGVFS